MITIKEESLVNTAGFPPKEAKIYLALLENGSLIIKKLSDKTGIKRTTLYPLIEKMTSNGIVGIEIRKRRKYYFIKNLEILLTKIREQKNFIEALIPQIQILLDDRLAEGRIQVYDTILKLRKTLEELNFLDPQKDEILTIEGDIKETYKIGFDFWKELLSQKKKLGIKSRTIIPSDDQQDFIIRDHKIKIRTSKHLNNFKIMLYLFQNKVLIIIPGQPLCIVIENKKIKESIAEIFEILWKRSKPVN